ncbi:ribbon-helix-helix protein, CopG family [Brucella daejeonensis]|uniref:ribbon-helix-helix protein, CopG family n=1 Tax=Brucella daejeonensis TaxID=659015 RepID=UPI00161F5672|nr:ribbon-helix-helix protein, CopG family [Brucella daejeonensis]NKB79865.1 ribbon-helix-helix protein, CopG family [Brucella daejeonensis]
MSKSIHVNTKTRKPRPKTTGELVGVRLQPEFLEALDSARKAESDLPNRPEAIRRILSQWLRDKGFLTE